MKKFGLIFILFVFLFSGCRSDYDKYDGLIVTDNETDKTYRLEHIVGDNYFIHEKIIKINGRDTSIVFE